jgi:thioredoxin-related protein
LFAINPNRYSSGIIQNNRFQGFYYGPKKEKTKIMKRRITCTFILFLLGFVMEVKQAAAQGSDGIDFKSGLSWNDALLLAKREGKFLFVDCYATWCVPCKYMSDSVFTKKQVGDFFNQHFVSISIQMDRTKNDGEEVRKKYDIATDLLDKYDIKAYPTYLFFNPEGQILHRAAGSTGKHLDIFVSIGRDALDTNTQYYSVIRKYKAHETDPDALRKVINASLKLSDQISASSFVLDYLRIVPHPYDLRNLDLLVSCLHSTSDSAFKYFFDHKLQIDSAVKKNGYSRSVVRAIVFNEMIRPHLYDSPPGPKWSDIARRIKAVDPDLEPELIAKGRMDYFRSMALWKPYGKAAVYYTSHFGGDLGPYQLNEIAWYVFLNCPDPKLCRKAVSWSRKSLDLDSTEANNARSNYVNYLDTYANLLYKAGNRDGGMEYERKALDIAQKADDSSKVETYLRTIDKMTAGQNTW